MSFISLNKNQPDFYKFRFLARAVPKENYADSRYKLDAIHVKDGVGAGTDTARLHVCDLEGEYPDGFYRIVSNTRSKVELLKLEDDEGHKFPDYSQVFHQDRVPEIKVEIPYVEENDRCNIGCRFADLMRRLPDHVYIDFAFFQDAVAGVGEINARYYAPEEAKKHHGPVLFENHDHYAAVMPLRF